jgi:very-short-patch-repair endonuclease
LNLNLAASTDLLPSPRERSEWRGGVGGGGWMPQDTQRRLDHRVPRARVLRRDATEAEKKLWQHLRQPPFKAHHFRRQATIGPYFADFASHQLRIVIELDGGQHSDNASDEARTRYLEAHGYRVVRFWNNEVFENMSGVLSVIDAAVNAETPPIPDPSPPRAALAGGGE